MNNLEKDFVPYAEAVALKELGFDELCIKYYWTDGMFTKTYESPFNYNKRDNTISAPLYQQAFRFLRGKYDWQHSIDPTADQHSHQLGYNYWIWNYNTGEEHWTMPKNSPTGDWEYETYEEAELECLRKLIGIVKNK